MKNFQFMMLYFTVCLFHWYMQEHHLDDELMSLALLSSQEDKKEAAM